MKDAYILPEESSTKNPICLNKYFVIGSDPECDLVLKEDEVSSHHSVIEKRQTKYTIRDLNSKTGVYVNNARILTAILQPNDIITLGNRRFIFQNQPEFQKVSNEAPLRSSNSLWAETLSTLPKLANSDFPVLILGESGTGKDVIAKALHINSKRNGKNLITINCSAISENLIESELFGHRKGSFTGAVSDRKGAFETARGGTLFLDEIGDLPLSLQPKLLRAIENQEIRPIGSDQTIKTNVRIISATHKDLESKIRKELFRQDLYYRLNVLSLQIPPLRERMEDFESLIYQFARMYRIRFSHKALQKLKEYDWPGNIRELKNFSAKVSALFQSNQVHPEDVEKLLPKLCLEKLIYLNSKRKIGNKQIEKEIILDRLKANNGNQRRTAEELGLAKSTLHDRIKSYRINLEDYKYPYSQIMA